MCKDLGFGGVILDKEIFMKEALKEAKKAAEHGDIPIGAVIVYKNKIISGGHNRVEMEQNPTRHAEIIAIENACERLGTKWLHGCHLYVTVEPCAMCSGAVVLARLEKLVYGTCDFKAGFCGSLCNIVQDERLNHYTEIEKGVMEAECSKIIKDFFKDLRERNRRKLSDEKI